MERFYRIFGIRVKMIFDFIKELPSATGRAMRN